MFVFDSKNSGGGAGYLGEALGVSLSCAAPVPVRQSNPRQNKMSEGENSDLVP